MCITGMTCKKGSGSQIPKDVCTLQELNGGSCVMSVPDVNNINVLTCLTKEECKEGRQFAKQTTGGENYMRFTQKTFEKCKGTFVPNTPCRVRVLRMNYSLI